LPWDRRAQEVEIHGEEISTANRSPENARTRSEAEKIIPINYETAEIIVQHKKLFREQFGREPGPDDPLFFDPGVATPQFLSDESMDEIWKSLLQAAGDSGIDPAVVYAMNKTGRIVTETNVHFLTGAELQEWNDTVDEYREKIESGEIQ
jgi:hypothetical protein